MNFEFVSHEAFPEDNYITESVVFCIDGKHRVTYVRKKAKNGGLFWDVISASARQNGEQRFLKSYSPDSNFLADDIKNFLNNRAWQKTRQVKVGDDIPF